MPTVNETKIKARSEDGKASCFLRIANLPRSKTSIYELNDEEIDDACAPHQLLEGQEYVYEWENLPASVSTVTTDPEEIFQPDTNDGRKGRLRPGLSTGALHVTLQSNNITLGQLELEVRSRKLSYRKEYRWMLRDIADQMTELVMDRFAASSASFTQDSTRDAVTLYQRFAFLRSLITSESFQNALSQITRSPHVAWVDHLETINPTQHLKASSHTLRQLTRPGKRISWPDGPIDSIPVRLERRRTEATHDTTPNRFVRFALERWRQVVADIDKGLASSPENPAVVRGRREVAQTLEQLDTVLHHDLFKDLSSLTRFPADDQVLHRREGYREVFRAYLEFEVAAQLSWSATDTRFTAGQRDVATLYEFWVFLQIAQLVSKLADQSFSLEPLIQIRSDGLNVVLQTGKETVLSGFVERLSRKMQIELCFNRTFGQGGSKTGSWTRPMRPDYSLIIKAPEEEAAAFEPIVLHFDAKYRVNFITELFGQSDDLVNTDEVESSGPDMRRGGALRTDLLKMHAYRDAIRRSAGAYVIYPGDGDPADKSDFKEYLELLPGLGAFALRPSKEGDASGLSTLRTFLDHVFEHVATRLTQHERGRYWLEEVYGPYQVGQTHPSSISLIRPGPDTTVLLGYVKSAAHLDWIQRTKSYNVRTQDRTGGVAANSGLLYSQLLLLYCPDNGKVALARIVSDPVLVNNAAMKSTGYPEPTSDYLCVQLSWLADQDCVAHLSAGWVDQHVQNMGKLRGEPVAVKWSALVNVFG